jgi:DnaK suppressor protein
MLKEADIQLFRQLLLDQREELATVTAVSDEAARPVELDQASVGRLSRMDAMQAQSMAQESVRRRKLMLTQIEGALRRIESGEFGACYVCGEDIGMDRLRFDPTTTRCIGCKDDD